MGTLPIGLKLKFLRQARGVRQFELSLASGVPQSTISAVENSYRPPRKHELAAILGALHLTPDDLERVRA